MPEGQSVMSREQFRSTAWVGRSHREDVDRIYSRLQVALALEGAQVDVFYFGPTIGRIEPNSFTVRPGVWLLWPQPGTRSGGQPLHLIEGS
jgi:hypothetical protein